MSYKLLFGFLVLVLFACAPLRPVGPQGEFPVPSAEPEPSHKAEAETEPKIQPPRDYERRYIIDVGIAFEKKSATIECPNKKWEFKAKAALGKHEIQSDEDCAYAGKAYRGKWSVLSTDSGIAVINSLPVEDYLKGRCPL